MVAVDSARLHGHGRERSVSALSIAEPAMRMTTCGAQVSYLHDTLECDGGSGQGDRDPQGG